MKSKNKQRLQQDKTRICKQIGILPNEEPELVIDRKEMRSKVCGKVRNSDDKRIGGWGECCYSIRTIFVDCSKTLDYKKDKYDNYVRKMDHVNPVTGTLVARCIKQKRTYRSYLETLVHELVHYRFAYLQHGKKYEQRIKEILRGRTFELKHVHLFSHMPKRYKIGIDSEPIEVEVKKEYNGSLDFFL